MEEKIARGTWALAIAVVLVGCVAAPRQAIVEDNPYAGWYLEHAGQGLFQPCSQSQQWRVSGTANLRAKAKTFGLAQDTPVYVRLRGMQSADGLVVSRVEQFGSPTPVRDCGMTGVAIPAP